MGHERKELRTTQKTLISTTRRMEMPLSEMGKLWEERLGVGDGTSGVWI